MADYHCPYCAQLVDTWPDPGGGKVQEYVEDCTVCCRPTRIRAELVDDSGSYAVSGEPE